MDNDNQFTVPSIEFLASNDFKSYKLGNFNIFEYTELESTNTKAESLSLDATYDRDVIMTWVQEAGRGQDSNKWESAANKNIALTLILKPTKIEACRQFAISMIVALGVVRFLKRYIKGTNFEEVSIKWPNDIYVGDKKICGILIEHSIVGGSIGRSLCGVGININQCKFISDAPNPISLFQLLNIEFDLYQLLEELLQDIDVFYGQIDEYYKLELMYLENLYRREGLYKWRDERGEFMAKIYGIDEYGQLILVDLNGNLKTYAFKEVKYL